MGDYNNYITYSDPSCGLDVSVRVEIIDNLGWFFATDICKMVFGDAHHTSYRLAKVSDANKKLVKRLTKSGIRNVYLVNFDGYKELEAFSECDAKTSQSNSDLLIKGAVKLAMHLYGGKTIEEIEAEEPEAVEKPLEEMAEEPVVESRVEEEKTTVEEKQINNNLTVFENSEFGEIRTEVIDGEPWFCLTDVCRALELTTPSKVKERLNTDGVSTIHIIDSMGRKQDATFINEPNLYKTIFQSRKESAERFTEWVTSEVLPSIRKTGGYQKPLTSLEQIQVIAKGTVELAQKVEKLEQSSTQLERNLNQLEHDMPLYGCEIDEVQQHVKRKGVQCLGGKDSEAYRDASLRGSVYSDIYSQLKREYGCVSSYKSIKRRYIADVHEFIDCYQLPTVLGEEVEAANAQMRLQV